jgi:UDP-N-acetylglucosamine 2-epimerase (non-hydrolysing)
MSGQRTVVCVAGARPNFMKVAPILRALAGHPRLAARLVHTGQHYDEAMSEAFWCDLELPAPDVHLGVGSHPHGRQTGRILEAFESALPGLAADLVLVVGDVNSTLAAALVAAKSGVPVAHVEAGLRSFDRAMPEEINRVLTDQLADLLFVTERSGIENLAREGIAPERVHFVGNTMIDTLVHLLPRIETEGAAESLGLAPGGYAVVTLHRPSNVDDPERLRALVALLGEVAGRLPVIFPVHPRTRARLEEIGLWTALAARDGRLRALEPQSYVPFLSLVRGARLVLTDSGGIQEETTWLGVPCLTLRASTERPSTTELGTNVLVGDDLGRAAAAAAEILDGGARSGSIPPLWDGQAAARIVRVIEGWLR